MKDPKQAAKELVDKYMDQLFLPISCDVCFDCVGKPCEKMRSAAKACAIITCDEVIKVLDDISLGESGTTTIDYGQSHYIKMKAEIINNI